MMKDIVERLASCTGQNVIWTGVSGSQAKTLMARTKSKGTFGRQNSRGRAMSIKLKDLEPIDLAGRKKTIADTVGKLSVRKLSDKIYRISASLKRSSSSDADSIP
eukprot:3766722-Prymnesium_polylepis.1